LPSIIMIIIYTVYIYIYIITWNINYITHKR
jgi:hypothetical protein